MIDVIGGKVSQKEIAFNVVAKMIDELMPRLRTLEITVRIKDVKDAIAYCMMEDNNRQFEIEISRNLSLKDFVTARETVPYWPAVIKTTALLSWSSTGNLHEASHHASKSFILRAYFLPGNAGKWLGVK